MAIQAAGRSRPGRAGANPGGGIGASRPPGDPYRQDRDRRWPDRLSQSQDGGSRSPDDPGPDDPGPTPGHRRGGRAGPPDDEGQFRRCPVDPGRPGRSLWRPVRRHAAGEPGPQARRVRRDIDAGRHHRRSRPAVGCRFAPAGRCPRSGRTFRFGAYRAAEAEGDLRAGKADRSPRQARPVHGLCPARPEAGVAAGATRWRDSDHPRNPAAGAGNAACRPDRR